MGNIPFTKRKKKTQSKARKTKIRHNFEGFNDWGGRGHDDFVPEEVIKTAPSGDETT